MTGFLCLGLAYGVLMQTKGYGPLWSVLMSAVAFGGSMQFVAITLLTTVFDPLQAFLLSVMVNARHIFYGLSLLEKYRGLGRVRGFLIYTLCDETFSLCSSLEPQEHVERRDFYFWISLLDTATDHRHRPGRPGGGLCSLRHHRYGLCADGAVRRLISGTVVSPGKPPGRRDGHSLRRRSPGPVWPGQPVIPAMFLILLFYWEGGSACAPDKSPDSGHHFGCSRRNTADAVAPLLAFPGKPATARL